MLKYCDTDDSIFDYTEISFTNQNGRPLEIDLQFQHNKKINMPKL